MTLRILENKLTISLVSYLNTKPFLYGIENSKIAEHCALQLDIPAVSGRKILQNEVDIALAPVAVLDTLQDARIITDFCIGANRKVHTVSLFSNVPVEKIETIYLDTHSLTSVQLLRILLHEYWDVNCSLSGDFPADAPMIPDASALLAIGDKSFALQGNFRFQYDLAEAWHTLTGLPFVFAAWITRKDISKYHMNLLNEALQYGVEHISETIDILHSHLLSKAELHHYFTENISYNFDADKHKALQLFLQKVKQLKGVYEVLS